jgi:uncharacterized protein DUF4440
MDVLQRRNELADALTAHDIEAVKRLLHPSFVVRNTNGEVVMSHEQLLRELPQFFQNHPEYKQTASSQVIRTDAETAILDSEHIEVLRVIWWPHELKSRWQETWKKIADTWMLTEEKAIPS